MTKTLSMLFAALALCALPLAADEVVDPRVAPQGLTQVITGTVVELHEHEMVVQTDFGRRTFELTEHRAPTGIQVGDRVSVTYTRTEADVLLAQEFGPLTIPDDVVRLNTTGTVVEITDRELVIRTDVGLERFRLEDVRVPADVRVGDRVTVQFTRTEEDVIVVQSITRVPVEVTVTPDPVADPALEPAVLPATASSMPLLALLGLCALLAAGVLRQARA